MLVLGPNGAGKTTLIKCIMDMIRFDGKLTVVGIDVKRDSTQAKSHIGYVPQNYAFYEAISVHDHAILSTRLKRVGKAEAEEKLKAVDLWHVRKRKVRALSDGMKQRLAIALAMIADPPILILDEPTSNVDLRGQLEFQALLQELVREGKTLLTTTHLTGLGELATKAMILDHGKQIALGAPADLLTNLSLDDVLHTRVPTGQVKDVLAMMQGEGAKEAEAEGEWVTAALPSGVKLKVIKRLLEGSFDVQDLLVERSRIESEYIKIIREKAS